MFRLALQLGHYDVDAMLAGTPPALLYEWMAFANLEPFGEDRADLRNAITSLSIMNAMGAKKRGGGEWKLGDFMPQFGETQAKSGKTMDPMLALPRLRQLYGNNRKSRGQPDRKDR